MLSPRQLVWGAVVVGVLSVGSAVALWLLGGGPPAVLVTWAVGPPVLFAAVGFTARAGINRAKR